MRLVLNSTDTAVVLRCVRLLLHCLPCAAVQHNSNMAHRYTRPSATADEQLAALLQVLTIQQRQIDVLLERPQDAPVTSHSVASRPATSHSGVRSARGGAHHRSHRAPRSVAGTARGYRVAARGSFCGAPCSTRSGPCGWAASGCPHLAHAWWRWGRDVRDCSVVACPRHPTILRDRCRHCTTSAQ